jgi:hypothetical protein
MYKARECGGARSACRRQYLGIASDYLMVEPVAVLGVTLIVVSIAMDCGKQGAPHVSSLIIVEVLIVRKGLGGAENMNSSRHVGVDQTR